ncbi:MAG: hypothetical protein HY840_05525 [Bacteroidetes bacterium]|nr:hypothetical protein [Bacteroidota bacterium]
MNFLKGIPVIALVSCLISIISCKKDHLITDSSAKIDFSTQSILFDTVFTTVGSTTKTFLVYNRNSQPIKISSIRLARGTSSHFRINVDGSKGVSFSDVEIRAKDSIFVFAEVTVDPNNQNSPLIIRDSVVFETNGNIQDVDLEAWGQNSYFYTPNTFPADGFPGYSVIPCNAHWTNDKPHVIYAYAVVPAGCTLTIDQGAKVYMHPNAVLYIDSGATLKINGNSSQKVIFQGDRLEPEYAEAAGQWGEIRLSPQSINNVVDWAVIKNGAIGIQVDTMGSSANPTLTISNTIIRNMSIAALFAQGSYVKGWNCVFANCGQYVTALTLGGKYNFYHCTFANYWSGNNRQLPVLLLNNYYKDINGNVQIRTLDSAFFYNCIVYGDLNSGDEIKLDQSGAPASFNYKFHYSVLRTSLDTTGAQYENVVINSPPYFYDTRNNDYRIKSPYSSAIGKGNNAFMNLFPYDLSGNPRLANPTITPGAYEYAP